MDGEAQRNTPYVLGHSTHELERLSAQARLYDPFTFQFLRDAGLEAGMRVLDVGCGKGDVSFIAARLVGPTGFVVGVDCVPAAVEAAGRRARELSVANTRFRVGDASDMSAEELFDAAVGRLVLEFSRDPSAMLRSVAAQVRPGGVIAFHEVDWSGCRSLPDLPTLSRCIRWSTETLERSGADPYMGLKLHATFIKAGLPAPKLSVQAPAGAGAEHPVYAAAAEFVRTVLPALEALGVATADQIQIDTLEDRMRADLARTGGVMSTPLLIGAWSCLPDSSAKLA